MSRDERTAVERAVLVLGAAPEAGWVADDLHTRGYRVEWVPGEDEEPQDAAEAAYHEGWDLVRLDGHVGAFRATLADGLGGEQAVSASAVVVAVGNRRTLSWERMGISPARAGVLTVPQARDLLASPRETGPAFPHRQQTILVGLDLGGETPKETATEALHLARDIRARWHSEVLVLYRDLQVDTAHLEALTRAMRDEGIVFCRYDEHTLAAGVDGVTFQYVEGALRGDLLIVPEDVAPREDTQALADLLRLRVGEDGWLQEVNIRQHRPGLSERKGIYYAGRCHLDADLATIREDAVRAAGDVEALLGAGYLAPEAIRAEVESERCARCLTCERTCPHGAVEVVTRGGVTAAYVEPLACWGCGACVANCPVQAIALLGLGTPAWACRASEGVAAS